MTHALDQKLAQLPAEPGVYLMKDKAGKVIYVGKAVNLRERVRAYFTKTDARAFVPLLRDLLGDIEAVVVKNEKEALLLENELIRRWKPRLNARPREGRNFVYLRLDPTQRYPRLEVTRNVAADGARYFGPYPLARALRETLRIVNRYFKLRTCSDHDAARHTRPCLLCQIARFPAPSVYDIPPDEYRRHVEDAILFLEGRRTELLDTLRRRMAEAAAAERFEEAGRLRDQLDAIERTLLPQKIVGPEPIDRDVFSFRREGDRFLVYALYVRAGRVSGGEAFLFRRQAFPDRELLGSFLNLYYQDPSHAVPDEVWLPLEVDGMRALEELLAERRGRRPRLAVPTAGPPLELLQLAEQNAVAALREHAPTPDVDVLERLQARLGLKRVPHRTECFDVSHFLGQTIVASKVAFIDGQPDKDRYRRFRIRTVNVGDDYAAVYEVVSRHLKHAAAEKDFPDLLVIDGGKGQLAAAQAAMKDVGATDLDVIALAKRREHRAEGEERIELPERIYVPNRRDAIVLPQDSPELLMLARLRDEAHRFAIGYQRRLMRRERLRSPLEEIPGIGAARRRALLRHFGSLEAVRAAAVDDLARVTGIGPAYARRVHAHLHPPTESDAHARTSVHPR